MKTAIEYPESKNPKVPEQIRPFYHSYPLQMRFNDIDMVGHLNNSIYLSFLDLGKIHYFKAVMGNQVSWEHIPVVVVNININYYSPTYLEEEIEVVTAVYAISNVLPTPLWQALTPKQPKVRLSILYGQTQLKNLRVYNQSGFPKLKADVIA